MPSPHEVRGAELLRVSRYLKEPSAHLFKVPRTYYSEHASLPQDNSAPQGLHPSSSPVTPEEEEGGEEEEEKSEEGDSTLSSAAAEHNTNVLSRLPLSTSTYGTTRPS